MVKINKNSVKNYFLIAWKELAVIAAVVFLDLFSKFLISKTMRLGEKKEFIKKFFSFYYTLNTEAAMGFDFWLGDKLGAGGLRVFFIALVSIATIVFGIFLVVGHKGSIWYRIPLALIIGGALGNLYDRIVHHAVRDFIHVEYFGKKLFGRTYFPTFNLADSALVIGVIMFVFYVIFIDPKYQKKKAAQKAEVEAMAKEALQNAGDNEKDEDKREEISAAASGAVTCDYSQFNSEKSCVNSAKTNNAANNTVTETSDKASRKAVDKPEDKADINNDIADSDKAFYAGNFADAHDIIESDARVVEVLDGKRNYSKKVVTETIITETIITETKGTAKNDKDKK